MKRPQYVVERWDGNAYRRVGRATSLGLATQYANRQQREHGGRPMTYRARPAYVGEDLRGLPPVLVKSNLKSGA